MLTHGIGPLYLARDYRIAKIKFPSPVPMRTHPCIASFKSRRLGSCLYLRLALVALVTDRLQVVFGIRSAARPRRDVIDLLCLSHPLLALAWLA